MRQPATVAALAVAEEVAAVAEAGDDINEVLEEIRAATAEIRQTTRETVAQTAIDREKSAEAREELEKDRRLGEHGRDWQILQERIDTGRTTFDDIVHGVDHSEEAQAVRRQLGKSLGKARSEFAEAVENERDEFTELQEAQEQLARTIARLNELNRRL